MIEIIPAVLSNGFAGLARDLERLRGVAPLVQVDVLDERLLAGQEAMPLWEEFDFEFDVMAPQPERLMAGILALGASRVVVHARAPSAREALAMLQPGRVGDYAVLAGIALRSHDTPEVLRDFDGLFDYVQVMGIDREGRQGEPPDPHHRELALMKGLRAVYPDLLLQVDGASAAHPRELVDAGAGRLIVGSAIVHADNPRAALRALYTEANAK